MHISDKLLQLCSAIDAALLLMDGIMIVASTAGGALLQGDDEYVDLCDVDGGGPMVDNGKWKVDSGMPRSVPPYPLSTPHPR